MYHSTTTHHLPYGGGCTRGLGSVVSFDADALDYFTRVAAEDGEELETGVKSVVNQLFLDLKAANLYNTLASGAFNLLDAPRTLEGCLVPIGVNQPINVNFVSGDITRGSGWKGDAVGKYIRTGRLSETDGQNDQALWVWLTEQAGASSQTYIGMGTTNIGASSITFQDVLATPSIRTRIRSGIQTSTITPTLGFIGASRSNSANFGLLAGTASLETFTVVSNTPTTGEVDVFRRGVPNSFISNCRIAAYGVHPAVDLVALRTCLTTYRTNLLAAL